MLFRGIFSIFLALSLGLISSDAKSDPNKRPNILWIIPDDMSANFSCYGEKTISTPHVDKLAAGGTKFTKAYVTAPVCSTCRSAFITGMYQTSIGAHHHRSGQGEMKIQLPDNVDLVPKLFQNAGYYTTLSGWPIVGKRLGKSDYNFEWDSGIYHGNDWSNRKKGQPFFAQIQTPGGKLRGSDPEKTEAFAQQVAEKMGSRTKQEDVTLPPYYPNDPVLLHDWAAYLDSVRETDRVVGEIVQKLKDDGDYDNTVIIFMTDHGISHARGKQFMYEEGLHVPLVISGPGINAGRVRDDLVEHIDIAALSLAQAGIEIPKNMQARDILAKNYEPRKAVFSARDRCDETVDHIRSVRTQRYKYIRNFLPERPHLQPCAYKDAKSILIALRAAHEAGTLNEVQERILFSPQRSPEELYDLENDPFEINNLAADPAHEKTLLEHRRQLEDWMVTTNDLGRTPEPMEMYDSDMAPYLKKLSIKQPDRLPVLEANIKQMKAWAADGK